MKKTILTFQPVATTAMTKIIFCYHAHKPQKYVKSNATYCECISAMQPQFFIYICMCTIYNEYTYAASSTKLCTLIDRCWNIASTWTVPTNFHRNCVKHPIRIIFSLFWLCTNVYWMHPSCVLIQIRPTSTQSNITEQRENYNSYTIYTYTHIWRYANVFQPPHLRFIQ